MPPVAPPATAAAAAVACRRLSYRYPGAERPALEGVDLEAARGELVALVGPSGCGKSTLLRLVTGLLTPTAGDLLLDGISTVGQRPERRGIGWVPQSYALFDHLDVTGNVAFGLRAARMGQARTRERVVRMLELCRIGELADRPVSTLSGGQRQRVAIARALAVEPRVLLLDEPLAALDPQLRAALRLDLAALLRDSGVTSLLVTHDQTEALALADVVVVLRDGRVEQQGPPATVYDAPETAFVAEFVSGASVLRGRRLPCGEVELAPDLRVRVRDTEAASVPEPSVAVRPSDLQISPGGAPLLASAVEYRGIAWRVVGTLSNGATVMLDSAEPVAAGSMVAVAPVPGALLPAVRA